MDIYNFRRRGHQLVDFIADYLENVRERRACPTTEKGRLSEILSAEIPEEAAKFRKLKNELEVVLPGFVQFNSPNAHVENPGLGCYPALLGTLVSDFVKGGGSGDDRFEEFENLVLNWLAKLVNLPNRYLSENEVSEGFLLNSSRRATEIVALFVKKLIVKERNQNANSGFVVYCSEEAEDVVNALRNCGLSVVKVVTDDQCSMRGVDLRKAIEIDKEEGRKAALVIATIGTKTCLAFDNLAEISEICREYGAWLHVDATKAGSFLLCPEFRDGVDLQNCQSFSCEPPRVGGCVALWILNSGKSRNFASSVTEDLGLIEEKWNSQYLALKVWTVLRFLGQQKLEESVRQSILRTRQFHTLVESDPRFQVAHSRLNIVLFRARKPEDFNKQLLSKINNDGQIMLSAAKLKGKFLIKFCGGAPMTRTKDIIFAWNVVLEIFEKFVVEKGENRNEEKV